MFFLAEHEVTVTLEMQAESSRVTRMRGLLGAFQPLSAPCTGGLWRRADPRCLSLALPSPRDLPARRELVSCSVICGGRRLTLGDNTGSGHVRSVTDGLGKSSSEVQCPEVSC